MGWFGLAVKGLWCGAAYLVVVVFMDSAFPGRITEFALAPSGIVVTMILFVLEIVFDYIEPPK